MTTPPQKPTQLRGFQLLNPVTRNPALRQRAEELMAAGKPLGMLGMAYALDKQFSQLGSRRMNPAVAQAVIGNQEDDAKKRRDNSMQRMKCGGKTKKMAKGGKVRGDGIAKKGKTKGRMV